MKTQNGPIYSNSKLDQQITRSQDDSEFRWTVWMAAIGICISLLYVAVCLVTGHPVIFYGS